MADVRKELDLCRRSVVLQVDHRAGAASGRDKGAGSVFRGLDDIALVIVSNGGYRDGVQVGIRQPVLDNTGNLGGVWIREKGDFGGGERAG